MPRDIYGIYFLSPENPVLGGEVIRSDWANNTISDLGTELTDSLSRSGKGSMEAPLKILDDSKGLPGVSFLNETGSGLKRESEGEVQIVSEGIPIFRTGPGTKTPEGWDSVNQQWVNLLPQGSAGNPENPTTIAANVTYDNAQSGLSAINVQAAIDERVANPLPASDVDYDNDFSGLRATATQAALDELKALIDLIPDPYRNPNNFMAGTIHGSSGNTVKSAGVPFTSARDSVGRYTITFVEPIQAVDYVVVAGLTFFGFGSGISTFTEEADSFKVKIDDLALGAPAQDRDWSFLLYFRGQTGLEIANAGFELGNMTGWDFNVVGVPEAVSSSGGGSVQPRSGNYFLGNNTEGTGPYEVSSNLLDLWLSGFNSSLIDAGRVELTVKFWQRAFDVSNDNGRVLIYFYESDGVTEVGVPANSGYADPLSWVQRTITTIVPANARYFRIRPESVLALGTFASAYFDDFSAEARVI